MREVPYNNRYNFWYDFGTETWQCCFAFDPNAPCFTPGLQAHPQAQASYASDEDCSLGIGGWACALTLVFGFWLALWMWQLAEWMCSESRKRSTAQNGSWRSARSTTLPLRKDNSWISPAGAADEHDEFEQTALERTKQLLFAARQHGGMPSPPPGLEREGRIGHASTAASRIDEKIKARNAERSARESMQNAPFEMPSLFD